MSSEIVKRLTGINGKEIREYTWPAVTPETKIIPPRGFSTPANKEKMREELHNRPAPECLQPLIPPNQQVPKVFIRLRWPGWLWRDINTFYQRKRPKWLKFFD